MNQNRPPLISAPESGAEVFKNRSSLAFIFVIFFMLSLIARLIYLQIFEHKFYSTLSEHNLLNVIPVLPNRGLIYDRNGVLLAKNIPTYTLTITKSHTKHLNDTLDQLAKIMTISPEEVKQFHHIAYQYPPHQPIPLKMKLSEQEVAQFYVNQYRFPGASIQTHMIRYYPLAAATSDILGYVARINQDELNAMENNTSTSMPASNALTNYQIDDNIGKSGIEKYYESQLRGKVGAEEAETDARGHIVRILKEIPPTPGHDLYLSIDSGLQNVAINALGDASGSVVVIQPSTGQVLALVTKPNFDPNPFTVGISYASYQALLNSPDHPLYNRAIRGLFSPGSTIKPFFALLALDDGIITPQFQIHDPGFFQLPNVSHVYHDWLKRGHGTVNVSRAIASSCDVFFYTLAQKMGIRYMDKVLNKFGFGELTDIDLAEEKPGLVPTPEWKLKHQKQPWYTGDTIVMGIGQGLLSVTPLQLAQAVSTIASRGKRWTPQLLMKWIDENNHTITHQPIPKPPIILNNPANWDMITQAMEDVVNKPWGTGKRLRHDSILVAAKTGTEQIYHSSIKEDSSRPKQLRNNHYIIGFAPADHPEIAWAVMIEHSNTATEVASQVITYYFARYHPALEQPDHLTEHSDQTDDH